MNTRKVWTACVSVRLGEGRAVVTVADLPSAPDFARKIRLGTLNVSDSDRYLVTSMDAALRAAQLVNAAEVEAETVGGGGKSDSSASPSRTAGIALLDANAAEATQHVLKRQDDAPTIKYAVDLVTGYHADVAVLRRETNETVWRSLGRRKVKFRDPPVDKLTNEVGHDARREGESAADALGRLAEAIVRPATRIVKEESSQLGSDQQAEGIAIETLMQWEMDPLGVACRDPMAPAAKPNQTEEFVHGGTEQLTKFEEHLPRDGDLPPRAEFGRQYRFGLRAVYPGGISLTREEAEAVYESPHPTCTGWTTFDRQERVGAPVAAWNGRVSNGPGDTLETLIVRSSNQVLGGEAIARRLLYAPSLPQNLASACPYPPIGPNRPYYRALDHRNPISRVGSPGPPAGGFLTVVLDPMSGGLPGKPADSANKTAENAIFRTRDMPIGALIDRKVHYYPDPFAKALRLELVDPAETRDASVAVVEVELYDERYWQAVPTEVEPFGAERCGYPHSMPVLLEVRRGNPNTASSFREKDRRDVGYVDEDGNYHQLGRGRVPPAGTVTVRRVVLFLQPGADLRLNCRYRRFGETNRMLAGVNLGLQLVGAASAYQSKADLVATETLTLRVIHAVQRPKAPDLQDSLRFLRRVVAHPDWPALAGRFAAGEEGLDQAGATQSWVGGVCNVDHLAGGQLSLDVKYVDTRDMPGGFEFDDKGIVSGKTHYLPALSLPVRTRRAKDAAMAGIELALEGLPDNTPMLTVPDTRAYQVTLTPTSTSRFANELFGRPERHDLTTTGEPRTKWLLATRRPDPLGYVELLPVFVWEECGVDVRTGEVSRRMAARLMWRAHATSQSIVDRPGEAKGAWFSSGAGEQLALLFERSPPTVLMHLGEHVTRIGGDAIRRGAPYTALPTNQLFGGIDPEREPNVFVPAPGTEEKYDQPLTAEQGDFLDLLTFTPRFDEVGGCWYVDLDIGPNGVAMGAPWIRLGLARFQRNALLRSGENRFVDLRCSEPLPLEFRLEPKRKVEVRYARQGSSKRWEIGVTVSGAPGHIPAISNHALGPQSPAARAPLFRAKLVRPPSTLIDSFGEGGDEILASYESEGIPQPAPAAALETVLWRHTFVLDHEPTRFKHYVIVEERDMMLSAHGPERVESGPRFMARVRVGGNRSKCDASH